MEKKRNIESLKNNILDNLKTISILYAENDNLTFNSLIPTLKTIFKNVYSARDGIEGLNLFKNNSKDIDIVLTEVALPGMDGIEMSEEIKKIDEDIELIACAAHSEASSLLKFIDLGLSSVAFKPVNLSKLVGENLKKSVKNIFLRRERDSLVLKLQEELSNVSSLNLKLKEEHEEYVKLQESSLIDHQKVFAAIQKEHEILKLERKRTERLLEIVDIVALRTRTDLKGNITFANNKFCEVTGYHDSEIIGKPHNIVRHKDVPSEVYEDMWKTIKSGDTFRREGLKNKGKDGKDYYVDTWVFPTIDNKGNIDGYEAIRFDVTQSILKGESFDKAKNLILKTKIEGFEQKRLQDEFSKTNREKINSLIDIIAHLGIDLEKFGFFRDKTITNRDILISELSIALGKSEKENKFILDNLEDKVKARTSSLSYEIGNLKSRNNLLESKIADLFGEDWIFSDIQTQLNYKKEAFDLMKEGKKKDAEKLKLESVIDTLENDKLSLIESIKKTNEEKKETEKDKVLFEKRIEGDLLFVRKELRSTLLEVDRLKKENKTLKGKKGVFG